VLTRTLLWLGGISYARGTKDPEPGYRILERNLAEMPPLKSRAALRYETKYLFAEVEGVVTNAQGRVDTDLKEQKTPGYAVMNAKVGMHSGKINLATGIDNVLDRFYYEHFSYQRDPFRLGIKVPEPGRSVFISASYSF
jgi:iron complex outermembrane receptor protein